MAAIVSLLTPVMRATRGERLAKYLVDGAGTKDALGPKPELVGGGGTKSLLHGGGELGQLELQHELPCQQLRSALGSSFRSALLLEFFSGSHDGLFSGFTESVGNELSESLDLDLGDLESVADEGGESSHAVGCGHDAEHEGGELVEQVQRVPAVGQVLEGHDDDLGELGESPAVDLLVRLLSDVVEQEANVEQVGLERGLGYEVEVEQVGRA
jgi:hypothetical protein